MKNLMVVFILVAIAHALIPQQSFEVLDVNDYKDKGRLNDFIKCVGYQGCCTWQELILRDRAPNIVASNCSDCTPNEKEIVAQLTVLIAQLNRTDLKGLMNIYDPSGKQTRRYFNDLNVVNEESGRPKIPDDVIDEYPDIDEGEVNSCF